MSCRLLFRLFLPGNRISGFRVRFLSFLPKAPVHFNTGAWALALSWTSGRWSGGRSFRMLVTLGVSSSTPQPHSFGNKLLFWPRRLLWARAVAVLTCKPWEGGAALAARGWGTDAAPETSRRLLGPPPLRAPGPSFQLLTREGMEPTHPTFASSPSRSQPSSRGLKGRGERRLGPPDSGLARTHVLGWEVLTSA